MQYTVLLVEDEVVQRMMTSRLIENKLGLKVREASNGKEAIYFITKDEANEIDLVLMDLQMPEMDGFEALAALNELRPDLPVIVLTGSDDLQDAIKAIKAGAVDFLKKPVEPERLHVSIQNALKINSLSQEVSRLRKAETGASGFKDIIGYEQGLAEVVQRAKKAASSDIPVLIHGETGVGKELFAKAIYAESKRFGKPFIAVNCAAIPKNLVESTLFGHEKGAFTGAIGKALGKFQEANGGTIFLDEIGELPYESQAKMLRALQQKEIEPVGASKPVKVNVRIISATNKDLQDEVNKGNFRADLLFRLNVLPIEIPPLRKRRQDIINLSHYFLRKFSAAEKKLIKKFSPEAENLMLEYGWLGNVREMENAIFRAVVLAEGNVLDAEDIQNSLSITASQSEESHLQISMLNKLGKLKSYNEIETEILKEAINFFGGNIPKAAAALGLAKSTIYRKLD